MGMHFGILAADLPWAKFFPLLSSVTGRFIDQGPVTQPLDDLDGLDLESVPEGNLLVAGEHEGRSYIVDPSFLLSMTSADFVVELSRKCSALVVACGAETMSGSYSFLAVRAGEVLRRFFDCQALLAEPLDEGDLLDTEDDLPLEDMDGKGLIAGLAALGFDFDGWLKGGERRQYLYTVDERSSDEEKGVLTQGPLADRMAEHYAEHALSEDERPSIMMFTRDAVTGQIVSSQDTGLRFGDAEFTNPEFWEKFWNRLAN
jgi:hypothetical protein